MSLFIYYVFIDFFSVNCDCPFPSLFRLGPGAEPPHLPRRGHSPQAARHGEGLSGSTELITGSVWLGSKTPGAHGAPMGHGVMVGCEGYGGEK